MHCCQVHPGSTICTRVYSRSFSSELLLTTYACFGSAARGPHCRSVVPDHRDSVLSRPRACPVEAWTVPDLRDGLLANVLRRCEGAQPESLWESSATVRSGTSWSSNLRHCRSHQVLLLRLTKEQRESHTLASPSHTLFHSSRLVSHSQQPPKRQGNLGHDAP